ncbi:MAG: UDP-N-acetylmuramoyl-tripeptide--D-alanyl-D-alanine ligase [Clostridiales bacterium]|nr:UDP-N-acetylmuramoyl-tripeptide--D-alanyl-D-alanine ligase [Clostridiales bacterium]
MSVIIILNILSCIICTAVSVPCVLRSVHMFQLNSYKISVQLKWMAANFLKYILNAVALAVSVISIFTRSVWVYAAVFALAVLLAFANKPLKNAKKPLVYTARVKRLLVCAAVIELIFLGTSFTLNEKYGLFIISLVLALIPFIPLIANIINSPIEKGIRQYYINDAKKILKACPDLIVIGITGSYGKTSVKYFLSTVLKAKYNVLMTPESYNTPMGVVKTIREQLRSTHEIFVCEMGARHVNDIKEICDIVFPDYGIITSIGEQHLETFKSIDNIIKTKFELFDAVENKEHMFLNGDNENIKKRLSRLGVNESHTYGLNGDNETFAYNISVSQKGTSFSVSCSGKIIENLQTPLIGSHNVTNLTGVISVCVRLGLTEDDIRAYVKRLASPPHRLQLSRRGNTAVIDDAYNSNPAGCRAALDTLKLFSEVKILMTPGMVELGKMQDECNYEFGKYAADVCDYVYLIGKKQTEAIYNGLKGAGFDESKIIISNSFEEGFAAASAVEFDKKKIILIENDLPDNY